MSSGSGRGACLAQGENDTSSNMRLNITIRNGWRAKPSSAQTGTETLFYFIQDLLHQIDLICWIVYLLTG